MSRRRRSSRSSVVLLSLAGLLIAGCGSDDATDSTGATSTSAASTPTSTAPTTSPSTTDGSSTTDAPSTSSPSSSTPDTATPVGPGFDPACADVAASGGPIDTQLDADLAELGPLGGTPAMIVDLPLGRAEAGADPQPTSAAVERIPGGTLWSITSTTSTTFDGSMLVALDADGSVRWVRCSEERWTAPVVADVAASPEAALLSVGSMDQGAFSRRWTVISLADGSNLGDLVDLAAEDGVPAEVAGASREVGRSGTRLLLAAEDASGEAGAADRLLAVDLATLDSSAIELPPSAVGRPHVDLAFETFEDGRLLQVAPPGPDFGLPLAVEDGAGWSTDPADLADAAPIHVDVTPDLPGTVRARRPDGSEAWARPDVATHGGEGFNLAVEGDVVLVNGCRAPEAEFCESGFALFGLDLATGETRWELDGPHGVGPVADGRAVVTEATDDPAVSDWIMIDVATGEPIEGQRWADPYTFGTECCGGEETAHTDVLDGVVVSVSGARAMVWYPQALTPATPIAVSLR